MVFRWFRKLVSRTTFSSLIIVLVLHGAVLWGLWQLRLLPTPQQAPVLFVEFIAPPAEQIPPSEQQTPPARAQVRQPVRAVSHSEPRTIAPAPLLAAPSPIAPEEPIPTAPTSPVRAEPATEAPPQPPPTAPPLPAPSAPLALNGELALTCPDRPAPVYPAAARRRGEEGTVVLRIELDELGQVSQARIASSSGSLRLDEAALSVVHRWRCTPAQRHGQPVRTSAMQTFKFELQEN